MAFDGRDVSANANLATNDFLWESVHGKQAPEFANAYVTNSRGDTCIKIEGDGCDYSKRSINIPCTWMQNNVIRFNFDDDCQITSHEWIGNVKTARIILFDKLVSSGNFYNIPLAFVGIATVSWKAKCSAYIDECPVIVTSSFCGCDMLHPNGNVRIRCEAKHFPCVHKKGVNYGTSSSTCKQSFAHNSTFKSQYQILDSMSSAQLYSGNRHVSILIIIKCFRMSVAYMLI